MQLTLAQVTNFPSVQPVSLSSTYTITETQIVVGTSAVLLLAANPLRKYLQFMVNGTQDVTVSPRSGVTFGTGMIFQANGANKQGGGNEFNGQPTNAFYGIALASGSSVTIWEGN